MSVDNATTSLTLMATVAETGATLAIAGQPVTPGDPSQGIALSVGLNSIPIAVTANNGATTKTYTVDATRRAGPSTNANLAGLQFSAGTLVPPFDPDVARYSLAVGNETETTTVTPTAEDATATITVAGEWVPSAVASGSVPLAVGVTTLAIRVFAGNGIDTKLYTVTAIRQAVVDVKMPPERFLGAPSVLAAGSTSARFTFETDEPATCRYATVPGTAFADMVASCTASADGFLHEATVSGLTDGTRYTYYVRCLDSEGEANTDDYTLSFIVGRSGDPYCEASGSARCYYVSPSGTGTDCSFAAPCTIQAGISKLAGGDVMYLLAGVYREYYDSHGTAGLMVMDKYFHFQDPQPTKDTPIIIKGYPGMAVGEEAMIEGDYRRGDGCVIAYGVSHVVFEDLHVRKCWTAGIIIGVGAPAFDITVRNSHFDEIVCSDNMGGVYANGVTGLVVEGNEFYDSYYEGTKALLDTPGCSGRALVLFRDRDVTIRRNEFRRTCSGAKYKHGEATAEAGGTTRIYRNYLHHLFSGDGIHTNQNRSMIQRNILEGCGIGVHSEDGTVAPFTLDVVVAHNTIIDGALVLPRQGGGGTYPGPINATLRNNILYDSTYRVWPYGSDAVFAAGVGLKSDYNCYFKNGGNQILDYFSSDNPAYGGATTGGSYSLPEYQAIGFDVHSVEADPQFANMAAGDYHLTTGSLCGAMGAYGR